MGKVYGVLGTIGGFLLVKLVIGPALINSGGWNAKQSTKLERQFEEGCNSKSPSENKAFCKAAAACFIEKVKIEYPTVRSMNSAGKFNVKRFAEKAGFTCGKENSHLFNR